MNPLDARLLTLFSAAPGHDTWRFALYIFAAEELIWIFPIWALATVWRGPHTNRVAVAVALAALGCSLSLSLSYLLGIAWPRPRPFIAGISHAFIAHAPTPSFPSNHATFAYTFALTFSLILRRVDVPTALLFLIATIIGISRVVVGVHYPTDIIGGLMIALLTSMLVVFGGRMAFTMFAPRSKPHS